MKHLICIIILTSSLTCSAQKFGLIKAGTAYSTYKGSDANFGNSLGYYMGVGFQDKFHDMLGLNVDIYYLNQITKVSDIKTATHSINATIGVNIYPSKGDFYFLVGPEVGHSIGYKVDGEKLDVDNDIRFGYVVGAGLPIGERLQAQAKYVGAINDEGSGYDYNIQIGLGFKISN